MNRSTRLFPEQKNIAMMAHDAMKDHFMAWAEQHRQLLLPHHVFATEGTAWLLRERLSFPSVTAWLSGPLGGLSQMAAAIAEEKIHVVLLFLDPFLSMPYEATPTSVLRLADIYQIPVATNRAAASWLVNSSLWSGTFAAAQHNWQGMLPFRNENKLEDG